MVADACVESPLATHTLSMRFYCIVQKGLYLSNTRNHTVSVTRADANSNLSLPPDLRLNRSCTQFPLLQQSGCHHLKACVKNVSYFGCFLLISSSSTACIASVASVAEAEKP